MSATYLFVILFLSIKESYERRIPAQYIYINFFEKVFSIPRKFPLRFETYLILIWILSISRSKIYLRSCSNLLIDTNPRPFPLKKWINIELHHVLFPLHPNKNADSNGTEQKMSSQEHPLIRLENDGYKNPQQIMSFKSHVAFYHIVSNEVLP